MNEWYRQPDQSLRIPASDLRLAADEIIAKGYSEDVDYPDIQPHDRPIPRIYTLSVDTQKLQTIKDAEYSSGQYEKVMTIELVYSEPHVLNMEGQGLGEMLSVVIGSDIYPDKTAGTLVAKKNLVYFLPLTPDQDSSVMETYLDAHDHRFEYLSDTPVTVADQVLKEMRPLTADDVALLGCLILQR